MAGVLERTLPRISINKLGEYMTATPSRRRLIVRDQRRPKGFLVPRYNEAQSAITSFLTAPERDLREFVAQIQRLRAAPADSAWVAQRNTSCAEALEAFLDLVDDLPAGVSFERAPQRPPLLTFGDVSVSVRPELIAHRPERGGTAVLGAVKFYFSKTVPLTVEAGSFIATALADFSEQFLTLDQKADSRLCLVVDVFARKIYQAPRSRVRRRADLAAACDEIARAWNVSE